jgi:hypothetical protein
MVRLIVKTEQYLNDRRLNMLKDCHLNIYIQPYAHTHRSYTQSHTQSHYSSIHTQYYHHTQNYPHRTTHTSPPLTRLSSHSSLLSLASPLTHFSSHLLLSLALLLMAVKRVNQNCSLFLCSHLLSFFCSRVGVSLSSSHSLLLSLYSHLFFLHSLYPCQGIGTSASEPVVSSPALISSHLCSGVLLASHLIISLTSPLTLLSSRPLSLASGTGTSESEPQSLPLLSSFLIFRKKFESRLLSSHLLTCASSHLFFSLLLPLASAPLKALQRVNQNHCLFLCSHILASSHSSPHPLILLSSLPLSLQALERVNQNRSLFVKPSQWLVGGNNWYTLTNVYTVTGRVISVEHPFLRAVARLP